MRDFPATMWVYWDVSRGALYATPKIEEVQTGQGPILVGEYSFVRPWKVSKAVMAEKVEGK